MEDKGKNSISYNCTIGIPSEIVTSLYVALYIVRYSMYTQHFDILGYCREVLQRYLHSNVIEIMVHAVTII